MRALLLAALLLSVLWGLRLALDPALELQRYRLRNLPHRLRGWKAELCRLFNVGCLAELTVRVIRANGVIEDYGVVCRRVVTNAGVAYLVDALQNLVEPENLNFHAIGTGTNAEDQTDTALQTEVESRATGTQSEPGSNQYRSTGTVTATASRAVTEHGLMSASSSGTLFDRSVFSAVNLASGDSIQTQYTLTLTAGG